MHENEEKTQSFVPPKKGGVNSIDFKKKLIIAIFVVIALILLSLCILIFSNVFVSDKPSDKPSEQKEYETISLNQYDSKIGSLIIVNENTNYTFPQKSTIVKVKDYNGETKNTVTVGENTITTYTLGTYADTIYLEKEALDVFNKMLADYCTLIGKESGLSVAWGYSNQDDITGDIKLSKSFYDQAVGYSLTLRTSTSAVNETVLTQQYSWINENMAKYGFIIRYPNAKSEKTGFDSADRIHLRYVGVPHAQYMKENNLCLEEYVELLKTKVGFENAITYTCGDNNYMIFYCEKQEGSIEKGYAINSVSGDGNNGYFVTLKK